MSILPKILCKNPVMSNRFRTVFWLVALFLPGAVPQQARAQEHVNSWFRLTAEQRWSTRFSAALELQHRRQSSAADHNPLAANLMYSVRPWLYWDWTQYRTLSVSPLAWYRLNRILFTEEDRQHVQQELRTTVALSERWPLSQRLSLAGRAAVEYRMFEHAPDVLRFRARIGMQYRFPGHWSLVAYDEPLVNLCGVSSDHFFDHNRVAGGLGYEYGRHLLAELGYIRIARLPLNNTELLQEHNFYLQLTCRFQR